MILLGRRFNLEHLAAYIKAQTWKGVRLVGVTFGQVFIGIGWRVK